MSYQDTQIKKTLAYVSNNTTVLDMLLEFEKTLDEIGIYAYRNWILGELVDGPEVSRYEFKTTWMYPYKDMPDPEGAVRLENNGCKVTYQKDVYQRPVRITGPEDYRDTETKQAKLHDHEVWLITITMPRRFIDEQIIDDIELRKTSNLDIEDLADAYEQDLDGVSDDLDFDTEEM